MANDLVGTDKQGVSELVQKLDLDFQFIQRNVRDLSNSAQFAHMEELEELHKLAYNNLKLQMAPNMPLAVDPTLVLEAYKTISGVVMQTVETKRKAAETLLKARSLIDIPTVSANAHGGGLLDDNFDGDVSAASLSSGSGVYGNLVDTADPVM